jgi:hypothetical protein
VNTQGVLESLNPSLEIPWITEKGGSELMLEKEYLRSNPVIRNLIEGMPISNVSPLCNFSLVFKGFGVVSNYVGNVLDSNEGRDSIPGIVDDERVFPSDSLG